LEFGGLVSAALGHSCKDSAVAKLYSVCSVAESREESDRDLAYRALGVCGLKVPAALSFESEK